MRITDTNLNEFIEDTHISKYGNYYFLNGFIVSEINKGVVYNWEVAQEIIELAVNYYGENLPVCLISNRIYPYATNPLGWNKFFKSKRRLNAFAVVSYTERTWKNAAIEKLFFNSKMERFKNIHEAVNWVKKINLQHQSVTY